MELARGLGEAIGSAGDLGAFAGAAGALVAASDLSDLPDRLAELAGECPGDAQELARGWYLGCQWLADRGLVAEPSALPPSIRSLLSGC